MLNKLRLLLASILIAAGFTATAGSPASADIFNTDCDIHPNVVYVQGQTYIGDARSVCSGDVGDGYKLRVRWGKYTSTLAMTNTVSPVVAWDPEGLRVQAIAPPPTGGGWYPKLYWVYSDTGVLLTSGAFGSDPYHTVTQ